MSGFWSLYEVKAESFKGGLVFSESVRAESAEAAKKLAEPLLRLKAKGKALVGWAVAPALAPEAWA